jgi:hypothetical protein
MDGWMDGWMDGGHLKRLAPVHGANTHAHFSFGARSNDRCRDALSNANLTIHKPFRIGDPWNEISAESYVTTLNIEVLAHDANYGKTSLQHHSLVG